MHRHIVVAAEVQSERIKSLCYLILLYLITRRKIEKAKFDKLPAVDV